MNDKQTTPRAEQEFLHDLCNAMTIAQGSLQLLVAKLRKNPVELAIEDVLRKVERSLESVEKMTVLVKSRRDRLTSPDQE